MIYKLCLLFAGVATASSEIKACLHTNTDCTGDAQCQTHPSPYSEGGMKMSCDGTDVKLEVAGISVSFSGCYSGYAITCQAAPCFSRDSTATLSNGESVPMTSLKSGDYVMDGPSSYSRIVVNQHAQAAHLKSSLLNLEHTDGSLSLTPDHVLEIDGRMGPARSVQPGSKLGDSEVSRVTKSSGGIINPLTASGKIMADGVLSSTYPEWIADYMLSSYLPLPFSFSNLLSFLFPATTQAYYDAALEPFFQSTNPALMELKSVLPVPLVALVFVVADLATAAGFVAFSLCSLKALIALVAISAALKARK